MIAAVKATGSHFFDKNAMDYWNSVVEHRDVIPVDPPRIWVFVSSERQDDRDFPTEQEALDFLGEDPKGAKIFHEAPQGETNGDGSQAEWWVVRFPRRWKVRTVNLDAPDGWQERHPGETWRSVVDTPERLNPHPEGYASRDEAFAVASEHALAWNDSRRDGSTLP